MSIKKLYRCHFVNLNRSFVCFLCLPDCLLVCFLLLPVDVLWISVVYLFISALQVLRGVCKSGFNSVITTAFLGHKCGRRKLKLWFSNVISPSGPDPTYTYIIYTESCMERNAITQYKTGWLCIQNCYMVNIWLYLNLDFSSVHISYLKAMLQQHSEHSVHSQHSVIQGLNPWDIKTGLVNGHNNNLIMTMVRLEHYFSSDWFFYTYCNKKHRFLPMEHLWHVFSGSWFALLLFMCCRWGETHRRITGFSIMNSIRKSFSLFPPRLFLSTSVYHGCIV